MSRRGDTNDPTHTSVNQPSGVSTIHLSVADPSPAAGQNPPRTVSDSPPPLSEIDPRGAESESPPDYVTYMREHSQAIIGHTNLSYVTDNPVFNSLNEPPPPYSDVFPSESKPDTEICSEPLSNHYSVLSKTMDVLY